MSDPVELAIIGSVQVVALALIAGWFKRSAERRAEAASQKVDEVARIAAQNASHMSEKVDRVAQVAAETAAAATAQTKVVISTTAKIHTLVNSKYGALLADNLAMKLRIAAITNDDDDLAAVEEARKKLMEHEAKQHTVDASEITRKFET